MRRLVTWFASSLLVNGLTIVVLAIVLPGFKVEGFGAIVATALAFAVLPALAWPLIYRLAAATHPVLFPILTLALSGLLVAFIVDLLTELGVEGVTIDGFWTSVFVAFGLAFVSTLVGALFSIDDDSGYEWFVERPLRRKLRSTPRAATPGFLYLEIDGLAEPILREALAQGYLPTLQRWIDQGSHTITPWETDLSSQTSASQAGILMGDNTEIPAFRWWDKQQSRLMVTSNSDDVRAIEARLTSGGGLLAGGGASRWNIFSGEAADSVATYSTFRAKRESSEGPYFLFFSNAFLLARTLALFVADVARERAEARNQRRHNIQPRIHRHFKYALVRASTTTLMQEASHFMLLADIYRGVPAVYNTFFGYDEVAHHSGIRTTDVFKVLRTLDRVFASLERAAARAPRPFHLVVLSDHGQSQGATFKQRFDASLDEVVKHLLSPDADVFSQLDSPERVKDVELAVNEALAQDRRTMRLIKRALRGRMESGQVRIETAETKQTPENATGADTSDVVVLASGNLGLISFPKIPRRLSYEAIVDTYPGLIEGLSGHPGVSFIVVQSEEEGWLVVGSDGINYLDHGYAAGEDPLAPFGPNAARHLKRETSFANVPDILAVSLFDSSSGEVAAFEELVGCHGGLGGPQSRPFVLHPMELDPGPEPIVGAAALNRVLRRWRSEAQGEQATGGVVAVPRPMCCVVPGIHPPIVTAGHRGAPF